MIDYAKIELPAAVGARLQRHPALSFIGKFDNATGAVVGDAPCIADYGPPVTIGRNCDNADGRRALQFIVYPSGRTIMHGSFHKYAHAGANWSDYTFTEFVATIADLCGTFDLDPHTLRLPQLEAGGNIKPPLRTSRTLQAIVCHREGHPFTPMRSNRGASLGIVMERDQYAVKVYDKGRQFGLPADLLRIELNPDAWQRLRAKVLTTFGDLFIAEPSIDRPSLTTSQRTFVELARTANYWHELTKGKRHKARARYADIVERFAGRNLKDALGRTLDAKLNDLLNVPLLTTTRGDVFTNIPAGHADHKGEPFHGSIKVGIRSLAAVGIGSPDGRDTNTPEQGKNRDSDPPKCATPVRRCETCGRDITEQRAGSRYCSEARYSNAGKRCRNAGSNPRHNRARSLERIEREPLLFDHRPYITDHRPY